MEPINELIQWHLCGESQMTETDRLQCAPTWRNVIPLLHLYNRFSESTFLVFMMKMDWLILGNVTTTFAWTFKWTVDHTKAKRHNDFRQFIPLLLLILAMAAPGGNNVVDNIVCNEEPPIVVWPRERNLDTFEMDVCYGLHIVLVVFARHSRNWDWNLSLIWSWLNRSVVISPTSAQRLNLGLPACFFPM